MRKSLRQIVEDAINRKQQNAAVTGEGAMYVVAQVQVNDVLSSVAAIKAAAKQGKRNIQIELRPLSAHVHKIVVTER